MKIKLDENMPVAFAVLLRHAGYDAMTVSEEGLAGIVVFRVVDQRWAHLKKSARILIDSGVLERLSGGLAVVDEARIRVRLGGEE